MTRPFYFPRTKTVVLGVVCILTATALGCNSDEDPNDPAPGLASIVISPGSGTVAPGGTMQFSASVSGVAGDKSVTWRSLNESVATVANGVVTGIAEGTTDLVALVTADTAIRAAVKVTVAQ